MKKNGWVMAFVFLLCWTVEAALVRTIDGDTFVADLRIWQQVTAREHVRILGINTPELATPQGPAAKAFANEWLVHSPFQVQSCKRDSFGRVLGNVVRNGQSLADALRTAGYAVK